MHDKAELNPYSDADYLEILKNLDMVKINHELLYLSLFAKNIICIGDIEDYKHRVFDGKFHSSIAELKQYKNIKTAHIIVNSTNIVDVLVKLDELIIEGDPNFVRFNEVVDLIITCREIDLNYTDKYIEKLNVYGSGIIRIPSMTSFRSRNCKIIKPSDFNNINHMGYFRFINDTTDIDCRIL